MLHDKFLEIHLFWGQKVKSQGHEAEKRVCFPAADAAADRRFFRALSFSQRQKHCRLGSCRSCEGWLIFRSLLLTARRKLYSLLSRYIECTMVRLRWTAKTSCDVGRHTKSCDAIHRRQPLYGKTAVKVSRELTETPFRGPRICPVSVPGPLNK